MKTKMRLFKYLVLSVLLIAFIPTFCYGAFESEYPDNENASYLKVTATPIDFNGLQKRVFDPYVGGPSEGEYAMEYLSLPEGTKIKVSPLSKDVKYEVRAYDIYTFEDGRWGMVPHLFDWYTLESNGIFKHFNAGGDKVEPLKGEIEFSLPTNIYPGYFKENEIFYHIIIATTGLEKNEYYQFYCKIDSEAPVVGNFTDVKKYHYFYEPVGWAVDNEITSGIDDEHFAPNMVTTRAQMVTFLWRAAGSPAVKNVKNDFEDVSKDSYYYDAVMWAVKNGITTGVTETEFKPDEAVTRAQAVTFLWRNAGNPEAAGETAFNDVVSGSYYEQAVKWAVDNNITTGITADKFAPNDSCTRAQIVTFLYRNINN